MSISQQFDTRIGQLDKGSKLWHRPDLTSFMRTHSGLMKRAIDKGVEKMDDDKAVFRSVANDLEREPFPSMAEVTRMHTNAVNDTIVTLKHNGISYVSKLADVSKSFIKPSFVEEVEAKHRAYIRTARRKALVRKRDEKHKAANELADAHRLIAEDAELSDPMRKARMMVPSYVDRLNAAAVLIAKAQ